MPALPPLAQLRAFEAAARHLSFKLAAAELGVTPTAISHQIRLLEQHCGHPLFRRRPRPLALTWSGEQLFPVLRDGFETFADRLSLLRAGAAGGRLRVSTTNAFAARWLVPRLPSWRQAHPKLRVEVIGTDAVMNLKASEADIAIRYARRPPRDGQCFELMRDTFHVVGSPALVGASAGMLRPADLAQLPLIDAEWPATDAEAPTWGRWERAARRRHARVPALSRMVTLSFREELHAMQAVIAGQGVAICSDVLVRPELVNGTLVRLSEVTLPGYGFYVVHRPDHPKGAAIRTFGTWLRTMV
jgi:LysR family transcriptional regulator, glycine cleavage system transcriptional activator